MRRPRYETHNQQKCMVEKRGERDSIMHTLTGAKLLKLIAVKLAERNAGEALRKTLHWNDGAHPKRKLLNVSRK
jgi:hypothetical protein